MKKFNRVLALLLMVIATMSLTACSLFSTSYTAASGFFYSSDKGHSYGDGTKEYEVGETVYMKVKFKVTSDKKKTTQVKVVLTIPNVQNVDAKYMDGQVITPNFDAVNNVTTYEFTANASKNANEQECVIQFVPNAPGSVTMTLVYDDNIDSSYDIQSTLEFVEAKEEPKED
ncbi:MAG: hypothetical protein IKM73_09025 [Acidaminococcaceae bacterium]|mgnify:FL=1|jgi:hypothetical protein|nr:hypothetical protein [Acidaminococcaceae bacterium]